MNRKNRIKKVIISVLIITAIASMTGCNLFNKNSSSQQESSISESSVAESTLAEGTSYGDLDISGMTATEAEKAALDYLEKLLDDVKVTMAVGKDSVLISGADADIKTNNAKTAIADAIVKNVAVKIVPEYTAEANASVTEKLNELEKKNKVEVKNATVKGYDADAGEFAFTKEVNGSDLDVAKTLVLINEQLSTGKNGKIEPVLIVTKAKVTQKSLEKKYVQLATYSTTSTNTENGTHNMALAFSKINGTVLEPGEVFSFNQTVGDSTSASTGFLPAGGLSGGLLVQMYGGGICQASSTIYGAALRSGMEIVFRDCHSQPSTYVPIGLDATVSYNDLDFQFKNPYDYPVYINTYMDGVVLVANFYGIQPTDWDKIEVESWVTETVSAPSGERYVVDDSLDKNEVELRSSAREGYYADAQRIYYKDGEVVKTEALSSSYYGPGQKTYAVGPGTNTDNLVDGKPKATATPTPTKKPKATPTPTPESTPEPTKKPKATPTPTPEPTAKPTPKPTVKPTAVPTATPTPVPESSESSESGE